MDSLLQLVNIVLTEIKNVGVIRSIAQKTVEGLREVRKHFKSGVVRKYIIAIFGQIMLAVEVKGYENYSSCIQEALIDEIYSED